MELMRWKFPHIEGEWSVMPFKKNTLSCGPSLLFVEWDGNVPLSRGDGETQYRGVRCDENACAPQNVWQTQVGGTHYTEMKIQPFQYSMANGLDPMQHTIIKYVSRFRAKNGIQDLEKAKQTIDLLIAYEKENPCNS